MSQFDGPTSQIWSHDRLLKHVLYSLGSDGA